VDTDNRLDEQDAIQRLKNTDLRGLETLVSLHQLRAIRAAYFITQDLLPGVFAGWQPRRVYIGCGRTESARSGQYAKHLAWKRRERALVTRWSAHSIRPTAG
jgi:hypothetical protein